MSPETNRRINSPEHGANSPTNRYVETQRRKRKRGDGLLVPFRGAAPPFGARCRRCRRDRRRRIFARHFLIDVVLFGPKSAGFPTNRLLLETGHGLAALCGWINALTGLSLSVNPEAFDVSNLDFRVINTAMAGQFNLHMKISFVTGLVLAMPYVLWEFWRFVKPALTQREIAATHRFVFWISACFFTGLLFGYFVIVPLSVSFFINYEASASIVNMIDVNQYLSTVIVASLASALVFQLPLLVYFLTRMGLVSSSFLKRYRRARFRRPAGDRRDHHAARHFQPDSGYHTSLLALRT